MDEHDSSPQSTLVILLGASQWPEFPDFHGSQAFVHVAVDFSRYLLDQEQFGLPRENFLNLFDTELSPNEIDLAMRSFLDRRTTELKQIGHSPTDLLFYFVGHGGFVGKNSEYYLAVRCTSSANPAVSGIRMEPLAATLTERARYLRRLIILDCCYAAAAFTFFQAEGPAQVAIRQTVDLFKDKAKKIGKGTALLCSSGKKVPSLLTAAEDSTLFSRALLEVLSTSGNPYRPDEAYLSLREVSDLTEEVLGSLLDEQAPRPELYSPDQVDGDVAEVPFFPNPIIKAAKAAQSSIASSRQEQSGEKPPSTRLQDRPTWSGDEISAYVTARLPHLSPQHVDVPAVRGEPKPGRQVLSRRTVLVGLAGLAVVGAAGGSLAWLKYEQGHKPPVTPQPITSSGMMFGFDLQHSRFNPDEHILSLTNVSHLVVYWTATTNDYVSSSPTVANGVVYVGSDDHKLYAFNAMTGATLWTAATGGKVFSSPAIATNGVVYVGSEDANLYAFNAMTGATLWMASTGNSIVSSPAVANGVVYIGSRDSKLYAFNATTGATLWTTYAGTDLLTSPAVVNGVVYIGSRDNKLYAFNATTGATLWTATTGQGIDASPAVVNGGVYIGSRDNKLYAFNATTGATLWTATTNFIINSSAAVANGVVYVGSRDGKLYAFNATTGAILWTATTGKDIETSPTVANGVVYVGSDDGNVYAFNAMTGATLWMASVNAFYSCPTVVNGVVYIGSLNHKLYAFHLPTTAS